jgi:nucleoside-diphosphate-sugar epimerase
LTRPQAGFRVARLSNVIGHGASPTNFLPAILDEARRTGTVTLRTSERSSKDYIDVDDVSPLLEQIALRGTKRIYNVASGANTTNLGIADLIRRRIGAKVTFSATSADIIFSSIDISRIRAEFRFVPAPFVTSFEKLIGTPQGEAAIENDHHH